MELIILIALIVVVVISAVLNGEAAERIAKEKGYEGNWFAKGFIFGRTAITRVQGKPNLCEDKDSPLQSALRKIEEERVKPAATGSWRCECGKTNASYVGTCACGTTKLQIDTKNRNAALAFYQKRNEELDKLEQIKKLKELLDMGAITQEEFERKKKEYL